MVKFLSITTYQQTALFFIFYRGKFPFGPENDKTRDWNKMSFFEEKQGSNTSTVNHEVLTPTLKCYDYTRIYNIFFVMQMFTLLCCRVTYEKQTTVVKTWQLIDLFFCSCFDHGKKRGRSYHIIL